MESAVSPGTHLCNPGIVRRSLFQRNLFRRSLKPACLQIHSRDFVFLPEPKLYSLRSNPKTPLRPIEQIISSEEFHRSRLISFNGGEGPITSVVAGCFTFASPESELLVKHLPSIIHLQASRNDAMPWFQSTLQFIAAETAQNL